MQPPDSQHGVKLDRIGGMDSKFEISVVEIIPPIVFKLLCNIQMECELTKNVAMHLILHVAKYTSCADVCLSKL